MSSYFVLSENTIPEKYSYYVAILKHVEIINFELEQRVIYH